MQLALLAALCQTTARPLSLTALAHKECYKAPPQYSSGCCGDALAITLSDNTTTSNPPSCCQDESTPFVGSLSMIFWHFYYTFGSSHIAISGYQKWPTKD